jgi:lipid-A-disaccharide synthase
VVSENLPGQLAVAKQIAAELPQASFCVSVANDQVAPIVESEAARCEVDVHLHGGDHRAAIVAADLVLVTSGTTTLDVAFYGRPMIVMYNASRVFYQLFGRWVIRTPYLSLPNILARKAIVPEFMPYYSSAEPIAVKALELLRSPEKLSEMTRSITAVAEPLRKPGASHRTAEILRDLIDRRRIATAGRPGAADAGIAG